LLGLGTLGQVYGVTHCSTEYLMALHSDTDGHGSKSQTMYGVNDIQE
jgi:hypothetical protein